MTQALPLTLGLGRANSLVLEALRKKRNVNVYSGDLMEPAVAECIVRAEALLEHTEDWLAQRRPDLLLEGDSWSSATPEGGARETGPA